MFLPLSKCSRITGRPSPFISCRLVYLLSLSQRKSGTPPTALEGRSLVNSKILIIDDDVDSWRLLSTILQTHHFHPHSVSKENDYPLAQSVQSLIVTLVIRFAAPGSHLAFRFDRSRCTALMALGLPRCTLAVSQPIA